MNLSEQSMALLGLGEDAIEALFQNCQTDSLAHLMSTCSHFRDTLKNPDLLHRMSVSRGFPKGASTAAATEQRQFHLSATFWCSLEGL